MEKGKYIKETLWPATFYEKLIAINYLQLDQPEGLVYSLKKNTMKPLRCLQILLLAITTVAFIPKQPADDDCLRISGIATQDGQLIEEATVKLFLGNKEIASVKTDKRNKGFHFTLKRNAYY